MALVLAGTDCCREDMMLVMGWCSCSGVAKEGFWANGLHGLDGRNSGDARVVLDDLAITVVSKLVVNVFPERLIEVVRFKRQARSHVDHLAPQVWFTYDDTSRCGLTRLTK